MQYKAIYKSVTFAVARMGEKRNVYRLLVGKPEGKRTVGRPRRRWIDNIKMDLLEIGLHVVDCIDLGSIKCWETIEWLHNLWPLEWYSAPQS
jgi:hypothetical protein